MSTSHYYEQDERTSLLQSKFTTKYDCNLEDPLHERVELQNKEIRKSSKQLKSVTYSWKNINVSFGDGPEFDDGSKKRSFFRRTKAEHSKQILFDVSGVAKPGELLVILGASGAGKTTLLNVLTFQNTKNLKIHGQRYVNGVEVGPDDMTAISGYIQQDELFIGTLTVREHLIFQALLKMPGDVSYGERIRRVEQVIQELGLSNCTETLIGITGRISGISGGEKKRLAFASEVLTDPLLLFCDEPSSGLDSCMAQNIVEVLKDISKKGKAIVCTIHQPSSEIFALFDQIVLMTEGQVAFHGSSEEAISFFSSKGLFCPLSYNPADYFLEILTVLPGREVETRSRIRQICEAFRESTAGIELENSFKFQKTEITSEFLQMKSAISNQSKYKASWTRQFRAIFWRSTLTVMKEPLLIQMRIYETIAVALLFGMIYHAQQLHQDGVLNITGALFIFLTSLTYQNVFSVVNTFSEELPIFLREHFNGLYRVDAYFLSKTTAELPFQILYPVLFNSICYFMIGLNPDAIRFMYSMLILVLVANVGCSFGYMIACLSPSGLLSMQLVAPAMLPLMIFGGFFLNKRSIPPFLSWIKYFSWFLYGNEALNINQWDGVSEIYCDNHQDNGTCLRNGAAVLQSLHFETINFDHDLLALLALLVAFRLIAFCALLCRTIRN